MITQWWLTGDCHGDFTRFYKLNQAVPEGETWGVIILGDAGFNFWLSKSEQKMKKRLGHSYPNLIFYCVRGNHEERPENLPDTIEVYDFNVQGWIWHDPQFPHINYFKDGETYHINGHKTLVIGGSYSIDKWYRLERQAKGGYGGWFKDEQLTREEMLQITEKSRGHYFDFVLAHTCPLSYQPRDLFLSCVDQNTVDNSMELWLEEFINQIDFKYFLFGHYHADRVINDKARMLYYDILPLEKFS